MLPREILKEYNTEKTAQNFGKKLFLRYFQDLEQTPGAQTVTGIPMDIWVQQNELQEKINNPETSPEDKVKLEQTLEKLKNKVVLKLLKTLEDVDPTNNKEYVQWMVRTYINDQMSIEDVASTFAEYLGKFNALKIKRHIKPPKNDVGQYKSFNDFMNEVDQYQDPLEADKDKQAERGKYEVIYDADNLLVLKPKDRTAACFFGRGTRWCTAATRGHNYFTHYNRQGPMYIIIPRKPEHPGEKYQFHFDSSQFAEETDRMLNNGEKLDLVTKYPQLTDIFKQQAEERGLFWLQKPIVKKDEKYTLYIYKKDNQPYLRVVPKNPAHENEQYFIEKNSLGDVSVSNEHNSALTPIEKYNFAERFPELLEKLQIDLDGYDPKTSEKVEGDGKTSVRFGERYVIVNAQDGQYLVSGGEFGNRGRYSGRDIDRGVYLYDPSEEGSRRYGHNSTYKGKNPYAFMINHPELNTMFKDMVSQIQKDTSDGIRRHGPNASYTYGWMAPHSSTDMDSGTVYEFGQNGKAIAYYITGNEEDTGTVISMNPMGGVDDMVTVDTKGNYQSMTFLQQVAFLKNHEELRTLLPRVDAFNPKMIDLGNAVLEQYNSQKHRDGREMIVKENYFLVPNEPRYPGERYSLTVSYTSEIDPATNDLYNTRFGSLEAYAFSDSKTAPMPLVKNDRYNRSGVDEAGFLLQLVNRFPKLKDYIDYAEPVQGATGYRGYRQKRGQVIDNDRVTVERFDEINSSGELTSHGTPTLLVKDKKDNDVYVVNTIVKDQRGKTGKIGSIKVRKIPSDLVNWDAEVGTYRNSTGLATTDLKDPEILALFRKFPEMVDIIRQENIHPKTPHPALVKVPDEQKDDLRTKTDTFRVERRTDNNQEEYVFFNDPDKGRITLQYPDTFRSRYNTSINSPSQISLQISDSGSYDRSTGQYGEDLWYDIVKDSPEIKQYITDRVANSTTSVVGAGKPTEIKEFGNIREYIFNASDGKLLYFTPITNPVKDSPEDTKENKWWSNGLPVPLSPTADVSYVKTFDLANDENVKKEIIAQADKMHGKFDNPSFIDLLSDTQQQIETDNSNLYSIQKLGSDHPVYKIMWNLPQGSGNKWRAFPSSMDEFKRTVDRARQTGDTPYPNEELSKMFAKISQEVGYGGYRTFHGSEGVYVKPDSGDIGLLTDRGDVFSLSQIYQLALADALYKNIPEIKKLIPLKKAKTFGIVPEQVRKLSYYVDTDEKYFISATNKPKGANYQQGWRNTKDLPPGTAYTIYYKNNNNDMRIMNTLYFPEKGPVVIFDSRGEKETYTTDQKISRFLDRFPELKELLQPFAKSNKWLKESANEMIQYLLTESELVYDYFDETTVEEVDPYTSLLENELAESLGDLAWAKKKSAEIKQAKKEWKPNYHFVKPGELAGSYTDQQMKDLGFKMASSGNWYMPQAKFQALIKSGKLREDQQAILEGKKLPRTSEFLQVKQDLLRLAGISEDKNEGSNISVTGNEKAQIMKKHDIQPGTDEWFRLWFSKPYLTGETPYGD